MSCNPFTLRKAQYIISAYIPYAVNILNATNYQKTIAFAKSHAICLIICSIKQLFKKPNKCQSSNSINYYLKSTDIFNYSFPSYTSKAIKVEAGIVASKA
ncbi:hypothetical protein F4678DRAFT_420378 [Xylaria arbuscula]|nr:hypothetical protein F4678DRAFT_420378 [Xylaria arbuscula]